MPSRHLQGENIQSYNLFSPLMMTTLWMKPGGNRPLGDNPLLFSISCTGSFICPVVQARLDIPRPLITQSRSTGGKAEMFSSRRTDGGQIMHLTLPKMLIKTHENYPPTRQFDGICLKVPKPNTARSKYKGHKDLKWESQIWKFAKCPNEKFVKITHHENFTEYLYKSINNSVYNKSKIWWVSK